MLSISYL